MASTRHIPRGSREKRRSQWARPSFAVSETVSKEIGSDLNPGWHVEIHAGHLMTGDERSSSARGANCTPFWLIQVLHNSTSSLTVTLAALWAWDPSRVTPTVIRDAHQITLGGFGPDACRL